METYAFLYCSDVGSFNADAKALEFDANVVPSRVNRFHLKRPAPRAPFATQTGQFTGGGIYFA
jgi:hypothetical protein